MTGQTDDVLARAKARLAAADIERAAAGETLVAAGLVPELIAVAERLRGGWLRAIQKENSCAVTGHPCAAGRCGCQAGQDALAQEAADVA